MLRQTPAIVALLFLCAAGARPPLDAAPVMTPRVDHHVHVLSPTLVADWGRAGVQFSRPVEAYATIDALLVPAGPLERAAVVSMAHVYGLPEVVETLELDADGVRRAVARENDFVAAEAARHGDRAAAFMSAPLRADFALAEYRRSHAAHDVRGVKIHLAASGFDPRDDADLARLEAILAWAESASLVVLLHLDPQRRGLEVEDMARIIDHALAMHPELTVCIAHLGGSGGYGPWTQSLVGMFAGRLEMLPNVYFGTSGVVASEETARPFATSDEDLAALRRDLARLGRGRLVFGSDHPVFDPAESAAVFARRVGLTETEAAALATRRLPGLWPE